jgi:hypothetical protein
MKTHYTSAIALAGFLLILVPVLACAGPVYAVDIDTSLYFGTTGAIYLQFNPGLNSDTATASIPQFDIPSGALLSNPSPLFSPGVLGQLDALPLVIPNSGGNNDYLHYLTYGNSVHFLVELDFPLALIGDSGSMFSFGLTSDDGLSPILTQDPSGFLGQIGYDITGAISVIPLSEAATITSAVPEPSGLALCAAGLVFALRRHRSRT